jgi:hypothetical protein
LLLLLITVFITYLLIFNIRSFLFVLLYKVNRFLFLASTVITITFIIAYITNYSKVSTVINDSYSKGKTRKKVRK